MTLRKTLLAALGAALLATGAPAAGFAQTAGDKAAVDAAKASGVVGEQADGYLGVVSGGDAALKASVAAINEGRAKAYAGIAAKTGVTVQQAGEATALQLISKLAPGQYYKPAGGSWTRK
ncbi:MAG: YdbL family protein [Caulobacteraceae bacterium]|nr:YdbL family protein [Caulobacteraceae bacterium]